MVFFALNGTRKNVLSSHSAMSKSGSMRFVRLPGIPAIPISPSHKLEMESEAKVVCVGATRMHKL